MGPEVDRVGLVVLGLHPTRMKLRRELAVFAGDVVRREAAVPSSVLRSALNCMLMPAPPKTPNQRMQ